jgi:hypothetical protein
VVCSVHVSEDVCLHRCLLRKRLSPGHLDSNRSIGHHRRSCLASLQDHTALHVILSTVRPPVNDTLDVQKARVTVHSDYAAYPDDLSSLMRGADGCIWAQGISQAQVLRE